MYILLQATELIPSTKSIVEAYTQKTTVVLRLSMDWDVYSSVQEITIVPSRLGILKSGKAFKDS